MTTNKPLERLRHHVSGAIARGEAEAIVEVAPTNRYARIDDGQHWTEGCGSIRPALHRFAVTYRSSAGECCEWYQTLAEAEVRLAELKRFLGLE